MAAFDDDEDINADLARAAKESLPAAIPLPVTASLANPDPLGTPPKEHELAPSRAARRAAEEKSGSRFTYLPDIHRLLPQAPDAEQGVISSFFLAPLEVGSLCVEKGFTPSHFHIPAHAEIFKVQLEIFEKGLPMDFITLAQIMRDRNKLDAVGGAAFVSSMFTFLPTAANAPYYMDIVEEKRVLRQMIEVCTDTASRCYDEQDEVPRLLDGLEQKVLGIMAHRYGKPTNHRPKDLVMQAIANVQLAYDSKGKCTGLETGFRGIDGAMNGLTPTSLIIIAARPSYGKTAFAMNIAEWIAVDLGKPALVFSLEMSAQQLMQRIMLSRARVNLQRVRDGFLAERDFPAITQSASKLSECQLTLDDFGEATIQYIRAKSRRWMAKQIAMGCKPEECAIFIDYLQLIESAGRNNKFQREQEVAQISRGLKLMAKELHCPVVCLAQLNRAPDKENRAPRLSDLRESGSIEQDADDVLFIDRPEMRLDANDEEGKSRLRGYADILIAKQRNGECNVTVPMTYLREFVRFEDRAFGAEPDLDQGQLI